MQRYEFAANFVAGKRVLDAGCGVGYGSQMLAVAGARSVVGVDISEEALDVAQKRYAREGVQFLRADCQTMAGVKGPFDVIVAFECLEHLQDVRGFLESVIRLLGPAGVFLCSTPNGLGAGYQPENPHHVSEFTVTEFESLLRSYFAEIDLTGQHWTAAAKAINILWSNPFMRLGRLLQRMRGRKVDSQWFSPLSPPTEGDLIISPHNLSSAYILVAICRTPV